MDMFERSKESTHKNKKPFKSNYASSIGKVCDKCRGTCIFSKAFLEQYPKSESLQKMADERFYAKEFELIRAYQENEEASDIENPTVVDMLKTFQSLYKTQKDKVMELHCAGSDFMRYHTYCHSLIHKHNKLIRSLPTKEDYQNMRFKPEARQKKKSNLVIENVCDVKLDM